jgi:hypothetical protein
MPFLPAANLHRLPATSTRIGKPTEVGALAMDPVNFVMTSAKKLHGYTKENEQVRASERTMQIGNERFI